MTMSGAPRALSTSAKSLSTCARSLASQLNARAPVSFTGGSGSVGVGAAGGASESAVDIGEKLVDLRALARIAAERPRPGLLHERLEIVGPARRERDLD